MRLRALRDRLQATAKRLWSRRYDLCAIAGAAAIAAGVALIYVPAGIIAAGGAAITWAVIGARAEAAARRRSTIS